MNKQNQIEPVKPQRSLRVYLFNDGRIDNKQKPMERPGDELIGEDEKNK